MSDIHNLCAVCNKDFYLMSDWDAHRVPAPIKRGIEVRNRCLEEKELAKLDPPITLEGSIWSTTLGHAKRLGNVAQAARARSGRTKKQKVAG